MSFQLTIWPLSEGDTDGGQHPTVESFPTKAEAAAYAAREVGEWFNANWQAAVEMDVARGHNWGLWADAVETAANWAFEDGLTDFGPAKLTCPDNAAIVIEEVRR